MKAPILLLRLQAILVLTGGCFITAPVLAQTSLADPTIAVGEADQSSPTSLDALLNQSEGYGDRQNEYILGPGDEVEIVVFGYEEYTETEIISTDGTISLPIVGPVYIADLTPNAAADKLAVLLNTVLVNPSVTLSPTVMRPVMITVAGEVQRPGPLQLAGLTRIAADRDTDDLQNMPTLSAAIAQAGGVTNQADIRKVALRRISPTGESTIVEFDLWGALLSGNAPSDPILQDGDTIYIPRLEAQNEIDQRLIARSSLASDTIRVRVVGEVTRPGEVQVPPNSSLSSAVAIAGGPTEDARLGQVSFVRLDPNGEILRQEIDLSNLTDTYQVQNGDVIIVPKRSSSSILDFAARLLNPLDVIFDALD